MIMNLSSKTQYACLAMLELAQHHAVGEPVQVRRIAERHGIRAGLATSVRGAAGGYLLARSPEELNLAEILDIVEGSNELTSCAASESPLAPVLTEVCHELANARRRRLEAITLADLLERSAVAADPMWYI